MLKTQNQELGLGQAAGIDFSSIDMPSIETPVYNARTNPFLGARIKCPEAGDASSGYDDTVSLNLGKGGKLIGYNFDSAPIGVSGNGIEFETKNENTTTLIVDLRLVSKVAGTKSTNKDAVMEVSDPIPVYIPRSPRHTTFAEAKNAELALAALS